MSPDKRTYRPVRAHVTVCTSHWSRRSAALLTSSRPCQDASSAIDMFDDMSKVNDIADRYVGQFAELDPLAATSVGITGFDHLMTDLSPEGFAARAALDRATIAELENVEASGSEDFAKQAMLERLTIACELYESGALNSELNVIA